MEPAVGEKAGGAEVCAGGFAVADDGCCLAETVQDVPGHRAEPARAGFAARVEEAAEGIEVVAGDDGSSRRQHVDELAVAVVDEVVQVERTAAGDAAEHAGVIDEPVQQAIGVPGGGRSALPGETREPVMEARADAGGRDRAGVFLGHVAQDHLTDVVHARPIFLGVVADKAEADGAHGSAVAGGGGEGAGADHGWFTLGFRP